MPVFDITSPDGTKYRVTAPEGATQDQALERVKAQHAAPAPDQTPAAVRPIANIPKDIGQDYSAGTQNVKQGEADLMNPQADLGGRAAGGVRALFGGAQQATSPATGAGRALISDPIRDTKLPGSQMAANVADTAISMVGPGAEASLVRGAARAVPRAAEAVADAVPRVAGPPRPGAQAARAAGYVLTPGTASAEPGGISSALGKVAGKNETLQAASIRNQDVTNKLAANSLGLPDDTVLNDKVFGDVRAEAGKAYQAVTKAVPEVKPDMAFKKAAVDLGGVNSQATKLFPRSSKNPEIINLRTDMMKLGGKTGNDPIPTDALMQKIKLLRSDANANLKSTGDYSAQKHALGLAQRDAAHSLESLIERNVSKNAPPDVIEQFRAGRRQIAKSYDIEGATNPTTGDVSARGLGKLALKGRPFKDELKTIADAANGFPKAFQNPQAFGAQPSAGMDFFLSGLGAAATGRPGLMALATGKPLAQSLMLSEPYQNRMIPGAVPTNP